MNTIEKLLKKFRNDTYSTADLKNLQDLLQDPVYNDLVEESMQSHWSDCENEPIGDTQRFEQVLHKIHHQISLKAAAHSPYAKALRFYRVFSKVAAILLLPLIAAFAVVAVRHYNSEKRVAQNTVTVPLGATSEFDLPDGTHIWLNAGSKLSYPMQFRKGTNRVVSLNGEGYFKVRKDKDSPFIVRMNGMDVKVTGTVFNARAYSDEANVTVALVEGAVQLGKLSNLSFEKLADLRPLQVGELNKNSTEFAVSDRTDLTKYVSWIKGITVFDNDPIQDVAAKLEKLYNVKVVMNDADLIQYRLTATFVDEPLDRALKIISLSSPINYSIVVGKRDSNGTYGPRTLILKRYHKTITR